MIEGQYNLSSSKKPLKVTWKCMLEDVRQQDPLLLADDYVFVTLFTLLRQRFLAMRRTHCCRTDFRVALTAFTATFLDSCSHES